MAAVLVVVCRAGGSVARANVWHDELLCGGCGGLPCTHKKSHASLCGMLYVNYGPWACITQESSLLWSSVVKMRKLKERGKGKESSLYALYNKTSKLRKVWD